MCKGIVLSFGKLTNARKIKIRINTNIGPGFRLTTSTALSTFLRIILLALSNLFRRDGLSKRRVTIQIVQVSVLD
jgi:hypothetical protein